jgi:cell division protein FtsQ
LRKPNRELIKQERRKKVRVKTSGNELGAFTRWARVLAFITPVTIITLLIAAFFTPLFSVKEISVVGVERLSGEKLEATLQPLAGRPLTMIRTEEVADLLAGFELIETFALQAEPPSTLRVKIRERQPLLIVLQGGQRQMYDAAGVRIAVASAQEELPIFDFQGNPQTDPKFKHAVELLLGLPLATYQSVASISVSDQLTAQFQLRKSGVRVFWGSNSDSLLKAEVLDSLLATSGEKVRRIDVSSPNAPVVGFD